MAGHDSDMGMNGVAVAKRDVPVVGSGEQESPFHLLQVAVETDATLRRLTAHTTGDILREHGPSLGKTPDPCGDFEPVVLTSPRTSRRERTFD